MTVTLSRSVALYLLLGLSLILKYALSVKYLVIISPQTIDTIVQAILFRNLNASSVGITDRSDL
jgi:hypothetical protein